MPSATSGVVGLAEESGSPSQARPIEASQQHSRKHAYIHHDDGLADEDGDEVFSNPDTAELESRSDATGATSPAPNSPGPGSPSNRLSAAQHIAIVAASSNAADSSYNTLKQSNDVHAMSSSNSGKVLALGALPQMNVASLQQQFDQRSLLDATPRPAGPTAASTLITPTRASSRPTFGRAISASGATMQTMSSSMMPTHSASGGGGGAAGRTGPPTPRLGGHASSQSASNFSLPHSQLPSAHGLPSDPRDVSTLSKLFAHPPAQSPAEELQGFAFSGGEGFSRRSTAAAGSPVHEKQSFSSNFAATTSRRLSRPTTRPPSPDRYVQPSRKSTTQRASVGGTALGLGLPARVTDEAVVGAPVEREASIFERDIEHRDASHILSKQEAIDVAIPSVLDDAVEAITLDSADQFEIISPHPAAATPLALSTQALSAHSNSQIKLQQPLATATAHDSSASSPRIVPGSPLSSAGAAASEPPLGSMAAQIAERFANPSSTAKNESDLATPGTPHRHRRPHSDVSSSSSSMRSRSPQAPLTAGVQQVLAANNNAAAAAAALSRSTTVATQSPRGADAQTISTTTSTAAASTAASPTIATMRGVLPTATALPALPLPNPYRSYSPTAPLTPLHDSTSSTLPSVSMDGAVMPQNESATLDGSLGNLADVIASHPSTSVNSLSNSPLMRMRGLGLGDDHSYEPSPYSARSPLISGGDSTHVSQPVSPTVGRHVGAASQAEEYVAPTSGTQTGKKRLSFFSYADIINQTPAEVLNFDEALRQAEIASPSKANLSALTLPGSPTIATAMARSTDARQSSVSPHLRSPSK